MSDDPKSRLMSLLVCWVIHAVLLLFIGFAGLLMGLLGDPGAVMSFYEPLVGDALLPLERLIELMASGAVWVLLLGVVVGLTAIGGLLRARWGRALLLAVTWLHIIGLIPTLLLIHLSVGFGGLIGAIFLVAELSTGIASVWVLKGSLKIIRETRWG
jgi:hypothetical protein